MLPAEPGPDFGNDFDRLQLMGRFAALLNAEDELGEAFRRFYVGARRQEISDG
jgi:hypothetical protein